MRSRRMGWISRMLHPGYDRWRLDHVLGYANMSEQRPGVVAVGEALIEFVRGGDGRFGIGCAGNTYNVALFAAGAAIHRAFAPAQGNDPLRGAPRAPAAGGGAPSTLLRRARARLPVLPVADPAPAGTHRRYDWRGEAPARDLFE